MTSQNPVQCDPEISEDGPRVNVGALIIRIGFLGPLNYNDNKEPPLKQNGLGTYLGPYITAASRFFTGAIIMTIGLFVVVIVNQSTNMNSSIIYNHGYES